ncbi:MAG: sulfur carrier protein ThiS [Nocardioides sp.]|nr:sulfur carrier protein ThiS [Nocardioides sp.]
MLISVNGDPREVAETTLVADLLPEDCRGTAVAVNGEVVARDRLADRRLVVGDRIEIVAAVQGG